MGMGIGINAQHPDAGEVRGYQEAVACGVWFTSKGTAMPKMLKYQDEEGEIHTLSDIRVTASERKYYCGILTVEFLCHVFLEKKIVEFTLLYYPERQEWKILWK